MESTVEQKLKSIYELQMIHTKVDKIRTIRGELPMEVRDLEDEVEGLETRISKLKEELDELNHSIATRKTNIKEALSQVKKYEAQLENVKNNREYEALTKEIEIQGLDIQVSEKKIKEAGYEIKLKEDLMESSTLHIEERKKDLTVKKEELDGIIAETQKEEEALLEKAAEAEQKIEDRLLGAYTKLRANVKNGLAVVTIERDSCSGCFNKIPPQRQADIRQRKKIIVCEHCGRILVDEALVQEIVEV
jgi:predicted  nucleic acid-binding Zn-ribbon protein